MQKALTIVAEVVIGIVTWLLILAGVAMVASVLGWGVAEVVRWFMIGWHWVL